ncbi:MAG: SDR family NAD(P)-dependent oxidoreductase [Candidatus Schekmanbacteria bacterium]|nr:SDR family NAD(P)-dependent oxidoreductase [Candidatus Schekmanbacteria bacterium]
MSLVLLTGASGLIGTAVAETLTRAGYKLRLLVRATSPTEHLQHLGAERVIGDVTDRAAVAAAMENVAIVVHTAGATSLRDKDADRVWHTNVEGTRTVLEAARAAGVERAIYTSSQAAVGAAPEARPLDEDADWWVPRRVPRYIRAKRRAEEVAWEIAAQGLPLVVLNPSIVLGPGDRRGSSTLLVINFVKGRMIGATPGGAAYVDVRDVAAAHLAAIRQGAVGRRYLISSENHTLFDFYSLVAGEAGLPAPKLIPELFARAFGVINDLLIYGGLEGFPDMTSAHVAMGLCYWWANAERSRRELGIRYRPVRSSIRLTLRWAMDAGYLKPLNGKLKELLAAEATTL